MKESEDRYMTYRTSINHTSNTVKLVSPNKKRLCFIELAAILFFTFYYLLPSFGSSFSFIVVFGLGILYLLCIALQNMRTLKTVSLFLLSIFIIALLYYLLTDTQSISSSASNLGLKRIISKMNQLLMMFLPMFMYVRLEAHASKKQKQFIMFLACLLFSYVIINTFIELSINPNVTREWENFESGTENNVGSYTYVYVVPIVISALTSLLYNVKKIYQQVLIIAIIAVLMVFLVMAQYTIALLVSVIGILLQVNLNLKHSYGKIILWFALVIGLFLLPMIIKAFVKQIESEQMADRLLEIADFLQSGNTSGYNLSGRFELYWKTIIAFLKSPILGNRSLGFDGHATLLVFAADIGIFGCVPFYAWFAYSKKTVQSLLAEKRTQFGAVYAVLIIMGLTNPIHSAAPVLFAAWFIAPMIIEIGDRIN